MRYFGLIWAALYRKPVRSFLTLASLFVAFLLFGLLQSVSVAFSEGPDLDGVDRLIIAPKYSIIDQLPLNYSRQILQVKGVEVLSHQTWFGGTFRNGRSFFPRFPIQPETFMDIYPELVLPQDQRQAFINTRTGVIIGRSLAQKFNLKVGDKLPLTATIWENKDKGPWEFDLVGIYDIPGEEVSDAQLFINYNYFDEYRLRGTGLVGKFIVRIDNPDRAAEVALEIDTLFANSSNETKTSTEKAYNQMFANQVGDIGFIMTSILSAVFFTILLLTGNTMAQGIRERIPELAILKTLGFSNVSVLLIVMSESILMVLIGCVPGLFAASAILPGLAVSVSFLAGVEMSAFVFAQGMVLAVLLGLIVGTPPALRALRLNIVDALGEHQ
ncbi:MAG: FtsX-like permease family protein [Halieaceae bacterium]|jgi:putative ABC transport system permease protein|nr:FtsX-like permease family protein [Halieaceae bacterium]